MKNELVTVLIAAYNEERHIAQCIESLLSQTYKPVEIIVIDDGSTDKTAKAVQEFKSVKLISLGHTGKANAINFGAAQAKGEILFFLDGDMYFEREYIAIMSAPIISGKCIGTCHTDEYVANPDNIWSKCLQLKSGLPPDKRLQIDPASMKDGSIIFRAIRKDVFIKVSGFENTGYLDDQTLYPKTGERAQFVKGAVCYHYNPETLNEVLYSGKWGGKTIAISSGLSSVLKFSPILSLIRSFIMGFKYKYAAMVLYEFVYELGIFFGTTEFLFGKEKVYGK